MVFETISAEQTLQGLTSLCFASSPLNQSCAGSAAEVNRSLVALTTRSLTSPYISVYRMLLARAKRFLSLIRTFDEDLVLFLRSTPIVAPA